MRPAGAVSEALVTLHEKAFPPLRDGAPGDALCFSHLGECPSCLLPLNDELPRSKGELALAWAKRGPPTECCLFQPQSAGVTSPVSTTFVGTTARRWRLLPPERSGRYTSSVTQSR
jgi:hypothetical protein